MVDKRADGSVEEAVEHLQKAATELLGAARAFLDAAEEIVGDPSQLRDSVRALAGGAFRRPRAGGPDEAGPMGGGYDEIPID